MVRQRGTEFWVGNNVGIGKDHTIYAKIDGVVCFEQISRHKKRISVYPENIYPVGGAHKSTLAAAGRNRCRLGSTRTKRRCPSEYWTEGARRTKNQ